MLAPINTFKLKIQECLSLYTGGYIESSAFKFAILLAQGARLATTMNQAISTGALRQHVLIPQL